MTRDYKMLKTITLSGMESDMKKAAKAGWLPVGAMTVIKTLVGASYIQHLVMDLD